MSSLDNTTGNAGPTPAPKKKRGFNYVPAVGPKLRVLLISIFAAVALLGATGIYLLAIRLLEWVSDHSYQTQFSLWMFLLHLLVGVIILVPFVFFGVVHLVTARNRPNQLAVKLGIGLFVLGLLVCFSGVALVQLEGLPQLPTGTIARWITYGLHIVTPVLAVVIYVLHRRAGPEIRWRWGIGWGLAVAIFVVGMMRMHSMDPRQWYAKGSPEGEKYFEPSKARTVDGKFIPAQALMMDEYCMKCHQDVYKSHIHSVHKFSSFNNPAYLFSVTETRHTVGVRASRWCAGCHDPVPFFSGAFDDPNFDMKKHPTANAGITCTTCHAMTNINSRSGNGDYTIEEPIHYPFAYSDDPVLQWVNNQLIKAKPDFHKKTFLKPFHRENEKFCSTCHKVGVPQEVNHYKEFLRGQNHPDSFWLSGVSGYGARSFYYPPKAKKCSDCHMPLEESDDFGSQDFDGSGKRKIHNHLFVGANTGIPALVKYKNYEKIIEKHAAFLKGGVDGKSPTARVDIFGLKLPKKGKEGVFADLVDDEPIRPNLPLLKPGQTYLVEVVVRTLNMGHHFTQGTADSNEVWVDFIARSGGKIIARSGGMSDGEDKGKVDEWAHFINVLMLDRNGNRIDRRNPQDIFTPLYDHQIPPGAANVLHYQLKVPEGLKHPIELEARVRFRKFDYPYMKHVHDKGNVPQLPIVDICQDKVILPVEGIMEKIPAQQSPIKPVWQRWNDYGIGCFLEGGPEGKAVGGELGAAKKAFERLLGPEFKDAKDAHAHGYLNLARVHFAYGKGDLKEATDALEAARKSQPPAPWWTVSWYYGLINMHNGNFAEAIDNFKTILDKKNQDKTRGFDFSKDWVVINKLGEAYFEYSKSFENGSKEREKYLRMAIAQFEKTLGYDPENIASHEFLNKSFQELGFQKESLNPQGQNGATPESAEEKSLAKLAQKVADPASMSWLRLQAARQFHNDLKDQGRKCRPVFLATLQQQLRQAAKDSFDEWLRLGIVPLIGELDGFLLEGLPGLGKGMVQGSAQGKIQAAEELLLVLSHLGEPQIEPKVNPPLIASSTFPSAGLPFNLGFLGMADRGYLKGPLPPPRLLKLHALKQQIRPLLDGGDSQVQVATALVLNRIHLLMHGIYKLDETAAGRVIGIYRQNHPAAVNSSQPIAIYELK